MGGKKKTKPCGYAAAHPSHVWTRPNTGESVFCLGIVVSSEHVHFWDAGYMVVVKDGKPAAIGSQEAAKHVYAPFDGPCECVCGQSAWLKDGRKKRELPRTEEDERFPKGDPYARMAFLKAKLDKGGIDSLSEEDREEINAIATAVIQALQPLMEAFAQLAAKAVEVIQDFLDSLDPEIVAELHRIAAVYAEPPEAAPDTIDLVDASGHVLATRVIGFEPTAAATHVATGIVEDALQPTLAPDPSDPVENAKHALREPFLQPFRVTIDELPKVQAGVDRLTSHRGPMGERLI